MSPQGKLRASDHSLEEEQRENTGHTICVYITQFFVNKYVFHTCGDLSPLDPFKGKNYVFYCLGNTAQGLLDLRVHNALNCLQQ